MPPTEHNQSLAVPIAIVVAGLLVAGALFFTGKATTPSDNQNSNPQISGDATKVPPVTSDDHILGNPEAPIIIIEYTDLECPFCKQFHTTMQEIMSIYGTNGSVAWVMRNFPLVQLHPNAPKLAEAAECISHNVGNAAYWKFLDEIFTIAPIGSFFPLDRLAETAVSVGMSADAFNQCLSKNTYKDLVARQFNDAVASGGQGTPHNIIVTRDGQIVPIPGAQPFATLKSVIDSIIAGTN